MTILTRPQIELATEKYSKEELATKETVLSVEPKPDEITPEDTEELTKVANSEEQSPAPPFNAG